MNEYFVNYLSRHGYTDSCFPDAFSGDLSPSATFAGLVWWIMWGEAVIRPPFVSHALKKGPQAKSEPGKDTTTNDTTRHKTTRATREVRGISALGIGTLWDLWFVLFKHLKGACCFFLLHLLQRSSENAFTRTAFAKRWECICSESYILLDISIADDIHSL